MYMVSAAVTTLGLAISLGLSRDDNCREDQSMDDPPRFALREGSWTHRGVRNIIGRGSDTIVTFRLMRVRDRMLPDDRTFAGWTVTYTTIHYPSVNERREPETTISGPFPVDVDESNAIITIHREEDRISRYTFAYSDDGEALIMPAFVEIEPGHFNYWNDGAQYEITCEHDPRKIPVGVCRVGDVRGSEGFYSYERAPQSLDDAKDKAARYLRIFDRVEEGGYLVEQSRLIWDDWGSPRLEKLFSNGEPRRHPFQLRMFEKAKP